MPPYSPWLLLVAMLPVTLLVLLLVRVVPLVVLHGDEAVLVLQRLWGRGLLRRAVAPALSPPCVVARLVLMLRPVLTPALR